MRLFHLSSDNNIEQFVPRKSKAIWSYKKYVWAIEERTVTHYYLPRDCPRICINSQEAQFLQKWIAPQDLSESKPLIFVPNSWKEVIQKSILFRYELQTNNFKEIDPIAGYFVSEQIEIPIAKETISCLEALQNNGASIYYFDLKTLEEIKELVVQSTNQFSIIRW